MKAVPYGSVEYWSSRYDNEERDKPGGGFEWYPGADDIVVDLLSKLGGYDDGFEALEIGSGSSELAAKLAASFAGSHVILSDFAENVVHRMRERLGGKDLEFHVVDCCRMAYRDGAFDLVVDKGTLDAVDCGDDDGARTSCLAEVRRVLSVEKGIYVLVSCREPSWRRRDFGELFEEVLVEEIRAEGTAKSCPADHFLYVLRRK